MLNCILAKGKRVLLLAFLGFASQAQEFENSWTYTANGYSGEFWRSSFGKTWIETIVSGEQATDYYFKVVAETNQIVHLYDASRDVSVVLDNAHCFCAGPNTGDQWELLYTRSR